MGKYEPLKVCGKVVIVFKRVTRWPPIYHFRGGRGGKGCCKVGSTRGPFITVIYFPSKFPPIPNEHDIAIDIPFPNEMATCNISNLAVENGTAS